MKTFLSHLIPSQDSIEGTVTVVLLGCLTLFVVFELAAIALALHRYYRSQKAKPVFGDYETEFVWALVPAFMLMFFLALGGPSAESSLQDKRQALTSIGNTKVSPQQPDLLP